MINAEKERQRADELEKENARLIKLAIEQVMVYK